MDPTIYNPITSQVIAAAIEVHRTLGAGLLEGIYLTCLKCEMTSRGVSFVTERRIPIVYKDMPIDASYRVDLIVEERVVVEVKAVAVILPVHEAQTLTYMALTECPIGLLINFNVPKLVDGVRRLLNPRAHRPPVSL